MAMKTSYNIVNNWWAVLAADCTDVATTIDFTNNGAELAIEVPFLFDIGLEIIACTNIATSTPSGGQFRLTVTREMYGTTKAAYSAGDSAQQRIYAEQFEDMQTVLDALILLLDKMTGEVDGVQRGAANTDLKVKATGTPGMTVIVQAGPARVDGHFAALLSDWTSATLTAPSGDPRIDLVEIDQDGSINIKTGNEAGIPSAPTVSAGATELAEIYHRVGESSIKDTDDSTNGYITDTRNIL